MCIFGQYKIKTFLNLDKFFWYENKSLLTIKFDYKLFVLKIKQLKDY